eukprot:6878828-Heterocapsa_arctica.AAC.1
MSVAKRIIRFRDCWEANHQRTGCRHSASPLRSCLEDSRPRDLPRMASQPLQEQEMVAHSRTRVEGC